MKNWAKRILIHSIALVIVGIQAHGAQQKTALGTVQSNIPPRPLSIYEQIVKEVTETTQDKAERERIIKEKMDMLSGSNPGIKAGSELNEEKAKASARNIAIAKWTKEIDEATTLAAKIEPLKRISRIAQDNPQAFYQSLEKVKKSLAIDYSSDTSMNKEKKAIGQELENLAGKLIEPLNEVKLMQTQKLFVTDWINALTQEQRNVTIKNLIDTLIIQFNQNQDDQDAENMLLIAVDALGMLRSLISPPVIVSLLNVLVRIDPSLKRHADQIIKSFTPEEQKKIEAVAVLEAKKKVEEAHREEQRREIARDIAIKKITDEINRNEATLEDKIASLKNMARIQGINPEIFYKNLENVKKDFAFSCALDDDLSEQEIQNIQNELETLTGSFIWNAYKIRLIRTQRAFAIDWIDAIEENQRDQAIKDLAETIERRFLETDTNTPEGQEAEERVRDLVATIYALKSLISQNTFRGLIKILEEINDKMDIQDDLDDLREEIEPS